jgi:NAD(P)-dependent dehydrogenase (short-subunit alcohol dehydrogenase family)
MMTITGRTAIVTGSGGLGCGRAIALRLTREGAQVIVSDIDESGGRETVRRIEEAGGRAAFRAADVRVEDEVRRLIEFAERTFGPPGILVNNASGPKYRPDALLEDWAETVQTDLLGTIYGTRLAIDAMRYAGGGAIINISSISALWHGRKHGAAPAGYDAAKAGVIRLTTGLAWLAAQENIRVNCLAPGWIGVPEVRASWESLTPAQRLQRGVPARLLEPEQIADGVVRLATDESLCGRILVWWSEDQPRLIPWGDPGYGALG